MLLIRHCNTPHLFSTLIPLTRSILLSSGQPCTIPRVLIHTVSSFHLSLFSPLSATVPVGKRYEFCLHAVQLMSPPLPVSDWQHQLHQLCPAQGFPRVPYLVLAAVWMGEMTLISRETNQRSRGSRELFALFLSFFFFSSLPSSFHCPLLYLHLFLDIPSGGGGSWTLWTNTPYIKMEACHHSSPYNSIPLSRMLLHFSYGSLCPPSVLNAFSTGMSVSVHCCFQRCWGVDTHADTRRHI